jgi:phosphoglycolate phosphatase-like HAD superfamily hydrolase
MNAEQLWALVERDVDGTATDAEADSLRADEEAMREWRAILVRMVQDHDSALVRIKGDKEEWTAKALRGDVTQAEWAEYRGTYERQRVQLVRRKAALVERLKECKDALHAVCQAEYEEKKAIKDARLDAIDARLDGLAKMLDRIHSLLTSEDA